MADSAAADSNSQPGQALATIQLEPAEVDFLASLAIASIAATTPRAVKRLVNIYRLVRSRASDSGYSIMGDASTPPIYPIIAVTVAIETGQPVELADLFYDGLAEPEAGAAFAQVAGWIGGSSFDGKPSRLPTAFARCPAMKAAFAEVVRLRGGALTVGDVLSIARLTRRYSFNRYR